MFICDDCRCPKHEFSFSGSYGPCELCRKTKLCSDIPSMRTCDCTKKEKAKWAKEKRHNEQLDSR